MRYAGAALLSVVSVLLISFAVQAGSSVSLLLGLSGVVAAVGMVAHQHQALRLTCATVLLANAAMIALSTASSGFSLFALVLAVLSLVAGVGILARQQWVRVPTVITSVLTLGPWVAAAMTAAIGHRWPDGDLGAGPIALIPGLILAAIWVWCPLTVARISTPRATAV